MSYVCFAVFNQKCMMSGKNWKDILPQLWNFEGKKAEQVVWVCGSNASSTVIVADWNKPLNLSSKMLLSCVCLTSKRTVTDAGPSVFPQLFPNNNRTIVFLIVIIFAFSQCVLLQTVWVLQLFPCLCSLLLAATSTFVPYKKSSCEHVPPAIQTAQTATFSCRLRIKSSSTTWGVVSKS